MILRYSQLSHLLKFTFLILYIAQQYFECKISGILANMNLNYDIYNYYNNFIYHDDILLLFPYRITYPVECQICQLDITWEQIANTNILKFKVMLSQEINNVDIGFSPTQNLGEKSDVITIGSTGSVQDGHIVK